RNIVAAIIQGGKGQRQPACGDLLQAMPIAASMVANHQGWAQGDGKPTLASKTGNFLFAAQLGDTIGLAWGGHAQIRKDMAGTIACQHPDRADIDQAFQFALKSKINKTSWQVNICF